MKLVEWVDEDGYKHGAMVRDQDDVRQAPYGVPVEPPPVNMIDWSGVKRDLHNALYDRGIYDWESLSGPKTSKGADPITAIAVAVLGSRIKDLLRRDGV